jgi:hypothetical protein
MSSEWWTGSEYIRLTIKKIEGPDKFPVQEVKQLLQEGRPVHFILGADFERCLYNMLASGGKEYVQACTWYLVPLEVLKMLHPNHDVKPGLFPGFGVGEKLARVAGRYSVARPSTAAGTSARGVSYAS